MLGFVVAVLVALAHFRPSNTAIKEDLDTSYICNLSDLFSNDILLEQRVIQNKLDRIISHLQLTNDVNTNSVTKLTSLSSNCKEAFAQNQGGGNIKRIRVQGQGIVESPFLVLCDNETQGGGWLVIQRRMDSKINFYRGWSEYQQGFGNLNGNFWIGLDKLYALTNICVQELLVVLEDYNGNVKYAKYDTFATGDSNQDYAITVLGAYSGTAGDSLTLHAGRKFTTMDRDNDDSIKNNCAVLYEGAWWYESCYMSNLNGNYTRNSTEGIKWNSMDNKPMKFAKMMIRPKDIC